jgi:hippurate hydrolase
MRLDPRALAVAEEATAWRRDLHRHPELLYELPRTSAFVAERLAAFGCDRVETGIGRSGVVATIAGRAGSSDRVVALRADMDALPIIEASGVEHASRTPGLMHACGHDGHTAMLLAAAKCFAETRDFAGTVALVFQPAEEGGAGAKAMLDDGLIERFGIDEIFGLHNMPDVPVGRFGVRPGAFMASADRIEIIVDGVGGHAARPNLAVDPVLAAAHIVVALQSVVARNVDPLDSAVVSITQMSAGAADNVIAASARLSGTARALSSEVRDLLERRIGEVAGHAAGALGATATTSYRRGYPVVVNAVAETAAAAEAARGVAGDGAVATDHPPLMAAEDFAYFLERVPGAFIFMGNGATAGLHHPAYDFDDRAIPVGASYWLRLAETRLSA